MRNGEREGMYHMDRSMCSIWGWPCFIFSCPSVPRRLLRSDTVLIWVHETLTLWRWPAALNCVTEHKFLCQPICTAVPSEVPVHQTGHWLSVSETPFTNTWYTALKAYLHIKPPSELPQHIMLTFLFYVTYYYLYLTKFCSCYVLMTMSYIHKKNETYQGIFKII